MPPEVLNKLKEFAQFMSDHGILIDAESDVSITDEHEHTLASGVTLIEAIAKIAGDDRHMHGIQTHQEAWLWCVENNLDIRCDTISAAPYVAIYRDLSKQHSVLMGQGPTLLAAVRNALYENQDV